MFSKNRGSKALQQAQCRGYDSFVDFLLSRRDARHKPWISILRFLRLMVMSSAKHFMKKAVKFFAGENGKGAFQL